MEELSIHSTKQRKLFPSNECVQVVVRVRPISQKEKEDNYMQIIRAIPDRGVIEIFNPSNGNARKIFTYDAVYDWDSEQSTFYDEVVRPLVASVLTGFNGCVFAYGQTGTGKTFTMEGDTFNQDKIGVIQKSFEQIWNHIDRTTNMNFLVSTSYLEIYMEEIRDLLTKDNVRALEIREREGWGTYVPGLHSVVCKNVNDMLKVMKRGKKNRSIGCTNMNSHSSRSHAAFMITIEMCDTKTNTVTVGKLNLIDLAGSERQSKTGASTDRLREASKINKSLSSLGNVISALAESSSHVPYRDSRLTRLLQDSLGGNSKTIMIANIGPASYNYDETLTTLRYAHRAKTIQNLPILNEDPKVAKLREYQHEISRLKALISERKLKEAEERKSSSLRKIREECSTDNQFTKSSEESLQLEEIRRKQLETERLKTEELAKILAHLESQLVRGGKNIIESFNDNQIKIEDRLAIIAEKKKKEIEMQQQLMLEEETTTEIRQTFTTLQQEVEAKTEKLERVKSKLLVARQELADLKEEHRRDRSELEVTQNAISKELKLKLMIIANFIPEKEKEKLYRTAKYDDDTDTWKISSEIGNISRRPLARPGKRRPLSNLSYTKSEYPGPTGIRHRAENILSNDLDMPFRTTFEYEAPTPNQVNSMLNETFKKEVDFEITSPRNPFFRTAQIMGRPHSTRVLGISEVVNSNKTRLSRPKTTTEITDYSTYPHTRSLVPK